MDGGEPVGLRPVKRSLLGATSAAVRIIFWNAMVLGAALLVAVAAGEVYLRVAWPFARHERPIEFVPGVGLRLKPHAEVRATNTLDFWTVERANSLGFLDREPPSPERAAASCHVAIVGDSFVEAYEVPVSDKAQVRLEQMAAEHLPGWDVTVAAYGHRNTAQVAQLPWWDEWIRHRPPKLVVLVVEPTDDVSNGQSSPIGDLPFAHVQRAQDGSLELVVPGDRVSIPPPSRFLDRGQRATGSFVLAWVRWRIPIWRKLSLMPLRRLLRPAKMQAPPTLNLTRSAFALDRWKMQVESGGARLVVLETVNDTPRRQMKGFAVARDIPVIDLASHILARGGDLRDGHFPNDKHWNPQGHEWAAEALLEWMAANPSVCDQ